MCRFLSNCSTRYGIKLAGDKGFKLCYIACQVLWNPKVALYGTHFDWTYISMGISFA